MNTVFGMEEVKDADGFFFLEEDYTVAPTIYETIENGLEYLDKAPEAAGHYFGITLDPTEGYAFAPPAKKGWLKKRFVTGPMVLRRDMFQKIKDNASEYCQFDEYNWDWSIVHMMGKQLIPHLVLVPNVLQVAHIGLEGGLHENSITKQKEARMKHFKILHAFHDKPSRAQITPFQHFLKPHDHGFGGWGHPADQHHCLELFGHKQTQRWAQVLHL